MRRTLWVINGLAATLWACGLIPTQAVIACWGLLLISLIGLADRRR